MISSKPKSGLSEASNNKSSPATPKVSKLGRGVSKSGTDSPSPQPNSRLSIDRSSPRSVESKHGPPVDRRSPRVGTPDKTHPRPLKGSELQVQLNEAQDELKKLKEELATAWKEKSHALDELKEAKRLVDEANEKLGEALAAQKRAEESTEIEKFRADELEQVGIEAAQKREEEWKKEIEAVRNQHAIDVSALLSTTQELQRVKQELAMTTDAKNQALSHADDATKLAEIHVEKVEMLSSELNRVKALLESKLETEANETSELVKKLNFEVDSLKQNLEKARETEAKLAEREDLIEQLRFEVETAKKAESDAFTLVEEWQAKAQMLETRVSEAERLERSASESLASLMDQLEGKSGLLQDAESEVASLRSKLESLEISVVRQKKDLEESEQRSAIAKQEASEMAKRVESLNSELEMVKEEKLQALNNEKLAASSVQNLLEEKNKLYNDLEASRNEEEKSKKAMESLASALHEVSSEAREAKEKLLSCQNELESAEAQVEDLNLVLKATNEKYEAMLDEAKHEVDLLNSTVQKSNTEIEDSKAGWVQKELKFINSIKDLEEESSYLKNEVGRLIGLLKEAEEDAQEAKDETVRLQYSLKETASKADSLKGVLDEVRAESLVLKERLLDKENELQSITQENEELRTREATALKNVDELSKLLEEATAKKEEHEENGELSDSEKDYDLLPKVVEFSAENGERSGEQKPNLEIPILQAPEPQKAKDLLANDDVAFPIESKMENGNVLHKQEEEEEEGNESNEVDIKTWDNCKIVERDLSQDKEPEAESNEGEVESKVDDESILSSAENLENGAISPTKQPHQKKKKPLLHKFGSLLKKGSTRK